MSDSLEAFRRFHRNVRLYLGSAALIGFCWIGIYAVLFNLYLLRLGYDARFVGLANAVASLVYAGSCLPAGAIGGRWGIRRTMILGAALAVVGLIASPLNEFLPIAMRKVWLVGAYAVAWGGSGLYSVNANPFLMSWTTQSERLHAFSTQVALWPFSGFAGNVVGGLLPGLFARALGVSGNSPMVYRYPLLCAGLLLSFAIPLLAATRDGGMRVEDQAGSEPAGPAPIGVILAITVILMFQGSTENLTLTFFNVYLDQSLAVRTANIGALSAAARLLAGTAALLSPLVIKRWGNATTFARASLAAAASATLLGVIPLVVVAGLGLVGMMTMVAIARSAMMVYQMEAVSSAWRPAMSGALNMGGGLSMFGLSLGGGYIAADWGYRPLFLIGPVLTVMGIAVFLIWSSRRAGQAAVQ